MIRYLIIDDEHIAHDIIKGYCDLLPNMVLQKHCYDALEALDYLSKNEVDLLFLDLNMPKLKGFDFLRTLPSPPKVIITTAYSEFALEGFELNVVDYLLKPFSFERFLKAVNKAFGAPNKGKSATILPESPQRMFLKSEKKYVQVLVDEILYAESAGNYVHVITKTEKIVIREKLSQLLTLLPADQFLQVHKSFLVAVAHIDSIEGNRIAVGEHQVPIGKLFKVSVDQLLK
jgi:DNA-binding LytR/AlgR family response regulator